MYRFKDSEKKGHISIRAINLSLVVVVVLFSVIVESISILIERQYAKVADIQGTYTICSNAADVLQKESDNLSFAVEEYVIAKNRNSIERYFKIIDEGLREDEVERAKERGVDCSCLEAALLISDELMEREIHAFALLLLEEKDTGNIPQQVREYPLSEQELGMSGEERLQAARELVQGQEYIVYKQKIYEKIETFEKEVLDRTQIKIREEMKEISRYLKCQRVGQIIENLFVILIAIAIYRNVTVVMKHYSEAVSANKHIELKGPDELLYLAKTINRFLDEQQNEKEELQWQAKYDSLTRVANKGETERYIQKKLNHRGARGALIFVDIDDFKHINDRYGHAEGDRAIQQVVNVVRQNLRDNDFVGRFGGDEFVLWIDGISKNRVSYIRMRINELNDKLHEENALDIPISISAGITFCVGGEQYEDVVKRADQALYTKKRNGKKGCLVYEEIF